MNQYEFKYYLRDEEGTIDEGFLLTDVISGTNKIMAEEAFLDILKDRGVNPTNICIISAEIIPEMEEFIEFKEEEDDIEDSFEYNTNEDEEDYDYDYDYDYDL